MSRRRVDPRLRELARQLGLDTRGNVARRLRDHALGQVREWSEALPVESVAALQKLVAGMLSLSISLFRNDADILSAARRIGGVWPGLEKQLRTDFLESDTLGLVMAHPAPEPGAHRYHAFIDARGDRSRMAYFTAWHEVAHLLLHPRQLELPGFRRVTAPLEQPRDPVEVLVDDVAGELAFWEPFAAPALEREIREHGRLTLDGVQRVRDAVAPEGSIIAAARALLRMSGAPMAFCVAQPVEGEGEGRGADPAAREPRGRAKAPGSRANGRTPDATRSREHVAADGQGEFDLEPRPELRIVSAWANERATRRGFRIVPGSAVPSRSAIAEAFAGPDGAAAAANEDQAGWAREATTYPRLAMRVDAGRFGPVAYALVICGAGRRNSPES